MTTVTLSPHPLRTAAPAKLPHTVSHCMVSVVFPSGTTDVFDSWINVTTLANSCISFISRRYPKTQNLFGCFETFSNERDSFLVRKRFPKTIAGNQNVPESCLDRTGYQTNWEFSNIRIRFYPELFSSRFPSFILKLIRKCTCRFQLGSTFWYQADMRLRGPYIGRHLAIAILPTFPLCDRPWQARKKYSLTYCDDYFRYNTQISIEIFKNLYS